MFVGHKAKLTGVSNRTWICRIGFYITGFTTILCCSDNGPAFCCSWSVRRNRRWTRVKKPVPQN